MCLERQKSVCGEGTGSKKVSDKRGDIIKGKGVGEGKKGRNEDG